MKSNQTIIQTIIDAIQDKKGTNIAVLDFKQNESSLCDNYIICNANSPAQANAISDSVKEKIKQTELTLVSSCGYKNSQWIILDYGAAVIHIFLKETRAFYDLDHISTKITPQYIENIE